MSHCSNWQRDVNDHAVDEDYKSSIWMKELLEGCLDSELQKQVNDKFERLDAYERGGITYFKILPYRPGRKHHQMSVTATRNHLKFFFLHLTFFLEKLY